MKFVHYIFLKFYHFKKKFGIDYIGEDSISDLDDFLEDSGNIKDINNFDQKITNFENELKILESERNNFELLVSKEEEKIEELKEKQPNSNNGIEFKIQECNVELEGIVFKLTEINNKISEKTITKDEIQTERDEMVKKSLMLLHSSLKKEHQEADKQHARYVELYTQERAKKHEIERKMMNLKMMVYKNYGLRLV